MSNIFNTKSLLLAASMMITLGAYSGPAQAQSTGCNWTGIWATPLPLELK